MIANSTELKVAVRNLQIMEQARKALYDQLQGDNPDLLELTSKSYHHRIETLQSDIAAYLCEHPADISLLLPPNSIVSV